MYLILEHGLRESMIRSYILILGFVVGLTEVLSLVNHITRPAIIISWSLLAFILLVILVVIWWKRNTGVFGVIKKRFSKEHKPYSSLEFVIMICIGLILLTTFIIAIYSPPNNFDSMTYHMARISNWIQNQNISYYPTSIPRQNYSLPLAEYVVLHLQIISQTDIFANLVQWSGFVLVVLLVSKIADYFQISRRGQLLTALFAATIPMAILQSSSTQNDLITGLGCLSFGYFLLRTIREKSWNMAFYSGLSLGIALLTKGTAYIYCAAIGIVIGISELLFNNWKSKISLTIKLVSIVVLALLFNSGVYFRNMDLYSNPLSTASDRVTSDELSLQGLYTNLIRNGTVQLALPMPELNKQMTRMVADHLAENNINPDFTFANTVFVIEFLINEDESGNFPHFVLLLLGLMIYPWIKDSKRNNLSAYLISILFSAALFPLTIKWQPWGSRLQLPIFFMGAPLIGYLTDKIRRPKLINILIALSLVAYSLPYLTLNDTRPLIPLFKRSSPLRNNSIKRFFSDRPDLYNEYSEIIAPLYKDVSILRTDRSQQYFSSNSSLYQDYLVVMTAVNQLDEKVIGLELGNNDWEYPIWVFADQHATKGSSEFVHVGVDNITRILDPIPDKLPEYIISTKGQSSIFIGKYNFEIVIDTSEIDLLRK